MPPEHGDEERGVSDFRVAGPTPGSSGAVANGAAARTRIYGPGYLSEVVFALDPVATVGDQVVDGGSVLVRASLQEGTALTAQKARWRYRGYVVSGDSIVLHPNVYLRRGEQLTLVVQVRARDNLISTTLGVNLSVSARVSMRPVAGAERDAHPYGMFIPGSGTRRRIAVTDPAAGAEWTYTVDTGLMQYLAAVQFTFTASVAAATRHPRVSVDDGSVSSFAQSKYVIGTQTYVASDSFNHQLSKNMEQRSTATGAIRHDPWPEGVVLAGSTRQSATRIRSVTSNLQGGDDYTQIYLDVEEWVLDLEAA